MWNYEIKLTNWYQSFCAVTHIPCWRIVLWQWAPSGEKFNSCASESFKKQSIVVDVSVNSGTCVNLFYPELQALYFQISHEYDSIVNLQHSWIFEIHERNSQFSWNFVGVELLTNIRHIKRLGQTLQLVLQS